MFSYSILTDVDVLAKNKRKQYTFVIPYLT